MTAVRKDIVAEFVARLAAIPGLAMCELMATAEPDQYPALCIDDFGNSAPDSDATHSRYTMTLQIEGFVQAPAASATPGPAAHDQLNELYAACVRAVMAAPERLGSSNVDDVQEGALSIDVSQLVTQRTLAFTLAFEITLTNRSHDPSLI
jgi:hypothetical protein